MLALVPQEALPSVREDLQEAALLAWMRAEWASPGGLRWSSSSHAATLPQPAFHQGPSRKTTRSWGKNNGRNHAGRFSNL